MEKTTIEVSTNQNIDGGHGAELLYTRLSYSLSHGSKISAFSLFYAILSFDFTSKEGLPALANFRFISSR
jgi:hypothetical protein